MRSWIWRCWLFIVLMCMGGDGTHAAVIVNQIYGANVDSTSTNAVTPCASSGFSVENTLTLTGFTDARFLRVNATTLKNNGGVGYVIGGNGGLAQIWLAAFSLDTMALMGTYTIQPAGGSAFGTYTNNGRYAGATLGNDLYAFMFNRQLGFGGTCAVGGTCSSLLKFTGASFIGVGNDTAVGISQLDDAKFAGATTLLVMNSGGGGNRFPTLWSTTSLTKLGSGASFATTGFTMVSRLMNSYNYVALVGGVPNMFRLPAGTTTFDASVTTGLGGRAPSAIYAFNDDTGLIADDTTYVGGLNALRNFMLVPGMTDGGNVAAYVVGDGSAAYQSTFWDAINSKVYTVRADGGAGLSSNIIRTDALAAIEQRFACATCTVNGSQGVQMADFNANMARLYLVNNANPPVVNKIKVCATGGP